MPEGVEVYVEQPHGLSEGKKVCLLRRALYGLKEAPLYWFLTIVPVMKEIGFEPFHSDLCLFYNSKLDVYVVLYVDDLLASAATRELALKVRDHLQEHFQLKDLGEAKTFLGYEIYYDKPNKQVYLSQKRYCLKMLKEFGYDEANGVLTPWPAGLELPKTVTGEDVVDDDTQRDYIKKTGKLNYLAIGTRADISFTVGKLCEANAKPSTEAEFINLTPAGISLKWINKILTEFGAPQPAPALLLTDSVNALATVLNPLNSARTRAIDIRYKYIIDQVAAKRIRVEHLPGDEMVADGLTKALGREKHSRFIKLLGLVPIPHQNTQDLA
jgi:hypothetical protein